MSVLQVMEMWVLVVTMAQARPRLRSFLRTVFLQSVEEVVGANNPGLLERVVIHDCNFSKLVLDEAQKRSAAR